MCLSSHLLLLPESQSIYQLIQFHLGTLFCTRRLTDNQVHVIQTDSAIEMTVSE